MLHNMKTYLKNNKLTSRFYSNLRDKKNEFKNIILDKNAIRNFKIERKQQHISSDGKIKVGFVLTQNIFDWGKIQPIIYALDKDERFDVTLLCVPDWYGAIIGSFTEEDLNSNRNYEQCLKNYNFKNTKIVNAWLGKNKFVDLKAYNFSYVIYNSPYMQYTPDKYRPRTVSKYTKTCYTPYGFSISFMFIPISDSWDFYRWLYCVFCTSPGDKKIFEERAKKAGFIDYQKYPFLGFPRMFTFASFKETASTMWSFSRNQFRVLWTPRWSTDDAIAGSNFLKYKDFMIDLINRRKDIDFVFRPHPFTFGNFIKTGQMTEQQVRAYKKSCHTDNSRLDEISEFAATFWKSNLLVTDFSSIIIEYFFTGNPIIFCPTKTGMNEPSDEFERILSCCYFANNQIELEKYIIQLKNGIDPLLEKRKQAIKEMFGENIEEIPNRISTFLVEDYQKNINKSYK